MTLPRCLYWQKTLHVLTILARADALCFPSQSHMKDSIEMSFATSFTAPNSTCLVKTQNSWQSLESWVFPASMPNSGSNTVLMFKNSSWFDYVYLITLKISLLLLRTCTEPTQWLLDIDISIQPMKEKTRCNFLSALRWGFQLSERSSSINLQTKASASCWCWTA